MKFFCAFLTKNGKVGMQYSKGNAIMLSVWPGKKGLEVSEAASAKDAEILFKNYREHAHKYGNV